MITKLYFQIANILKMLDYASWSQGHKLYFLHLLNPSAYFAEENSPCYQQ